MKNAVKTIIALLLLFTLLVSCGPSSESVTTTTDGGSSEPVTTDDNQTFDEPRAVAKKTMKWPEGQVFPTFSEPEGKLIAFPSDVLSDLEMAALSCMEGLVNSVKTRMVILDGKTSTWLTQYGYKCTTATTGNVYDHIADLYKDSVAGVVIYSTTKSNEYLNLACSIANTMRAVPLTLSAYKKWTRKGIDLPVLADISDLTYTKQADIFQYFYDNYWENCNHDILVVQRPGLYIQMRDIAAAVGGAVVHLDCTDSAQTKLFKKFMDDMTPGQSILMGWYEDQERELMTTAAQCGLSCVPADFFSNQTVFGQDMEIAINAVPDMPELENKIYIAYYLSDGDNIQYDMGAMREYWDNNSTRRGQVAVNWTISPALAEVAPGMMNYYYSGATEKECFVCGPSGMGYTMPMNSWGANTGNNFRSEEKFTAYVQLTNKYMQKTGLRVVTIWDNLSTAQRRVYANEGTYLYGLTVQHFTNGSLGAGYTGVSHNMLFIQQTPGYFASNAEGTTPLTQIEGDIKNAVSYLKYNGSAPVFVATQVSVWAFHNISDVVNLEKDLSSFYEKTYGSDVVEFVRADHFFNLYYQANGLPFDITLKSGIEASATSNSESAALTTDGTPYDSSIWAASESGEQSVTYSLGASYEVTELAVLHAETNGLDKSLNSKEFKVEFSTDGNTWINPVTVSNADQDGWTTVTFGEEGTGVTCSYVRITVTDAGSDGIARIADVNIYGILK